MTTASRAGSVMYSVKMRYLPLLGVLVSRQAIPLGSVELTVYVVSRDWRSVKVLPSVTTYWSVSTLVLSTVGL